MNAVFNLEAEYKKFVDKIKSPKQKIDDPKVIQIIYGVIGIGSEIGELIIANRNKDSVNMVEEIGDVMWYITILCNTWNLNFTDIISSDLDKIENDKSEFPIEDLIIESSALIDIVKKCIFYDRDLFNKVIKNTVVKVLQRLLKVLEIICIQYNISGLPRCIDVNINKLNCRYNGVYDSNKAIERNVAKEYNYIKRIPGDCNE